jgi:hypothetical protein
MKDNIRKQVLSFGSGSSDRFRSCGLRRMGETPTGC